jgi:hypothetical protein
LGNICFRLQIKGPMLKTIILGTQRKAEIFQQWLNNSAHFEFCGFYDPDDSANSDVLGRLMYTFELAQKAEVFIIDSSIRNIDTLLLQQLIRTGRHILMDGFVLQNTHDILELSKLQNEGRNCVHIANTLHGKPLFTTAAQYVKKPRFIRIEKSCDAPKPGEFENWFYENLSEELDIMLRISQSNVRHLAARPLFLFGDKPDLLNIHIEFDNDAICHITAGRAIEQGTHKCRVFQQDQLFQLDFTNNSLVEYRPSGNKDQLSILEDDEIKLSGEFTEIIRPIMPYDHWKMELRNFAENIDKNLSPITGLEHMLQVAELSESLVDRVQRRYMEV